MQAILIAAGTLGGLGLIFGILLYVTGRVFHVETDPKIADLREALPGVNCGACGFPGCDGYAEAMTTQGAAVNLCPVGGKAVSDNLAEIMGVTAGAQVRKIATVKCQGTLDRCKSKYIYDGVADCLAASLVSDGNKACHFACLGLGTCARVCPFDAIEMNDKQKIAVVHADKCTGCGLCVPACPKKVLVMEPEHLPVQLLCRAADEGKLVSDNCKVGCIGCELCYKNCKFGAITMVDHLPVINQGKCVGCMMCAEVCPTMAIQGDMDSRREAVINQAECIGCGMCKRTCQFEAIAGERKKPHDITEACTGCGQCVPVCPTKCITMRVRRHTRDAFAKVGTSEEIPAAVPVQVPEDAENRD